MKQNGKLVASSDTTQGEQSDRFVQISPAKIFKPIAEYEAYFNCQPWHHIAVISNQYGLVYVWDTREIQSICIILPEDWNKLHHPVDNAKDLLLKSNADKEIVSVIEALQSKLTDDDMFSDLHRCRKQINKTCQDMQFQIDEEELDNAMRMASIKAISFWKMGWHKQFTADEFISAAQLGVCEAMLRFNPTRGTIKHTKFTSYAYFWIRKYLQEYATKNKTMLSAPLGDKWCNLVPMTVSYDVQDDSESDTAGSDHLVCLTSDVDIFDDIVEQEQRNKRFILFSEMLSELEERERLAYCLHHGIGSVSAMPMKSKAIAKAMQIRIYDVEQLIEHAEHRMQTDIHDKFLDKFKTIEIN